MSHEPSYLDVSTDLKRCIYASYTKDKFRNKEFIHFYNEALKNLSAAKKEKTTKDIEIAESLIKNSQKLDGDYRRDSLLTAAILLRI
ncbi:hypothetical protein A2803_00570 [Candidatus Woesebacteria bacterium RIFCSPHIGHO2_01_FULL_44_21]|uniref:Uncharacterized protein n=1 Tax=Candidatus Woesebacteria bacterium RIFCSPHIGHO2_01_FULL_44_21 TaxID=1802503 RepID=A0A1F7YXY3_9BACT|nr:MAG: hypothetical protein A2803_00570 [Candidatus Woesebacteria bacterium RIFCSPHIGHO2_01_FULL_44_21]OGM69338.1 MAG: hypothetical protein A2897_01735 [Candidatus Woesebacteria bacterium RIFCSPLOWO2_01_FULL_44_24b]